MSTYIIKGEQPIIKETIRKIVSNGGSVEYISPVLPIIGVTMDEFTKNEIENQFNFDYIRESVTGNLQESEGSLTNLQKNITKIIPGLDFGLLTKHGLTGWGTSVAILDSGVAESWVVEHNDYTGYGSTPYLDHGTKVANVVKQAAPGAQILSYKVTQEGKVKDIDLLNAIVDAVNKADIINISIGFTHSCSSSSPCALCEHVNYYTRNMDKLFVVAAGNLGNEQSVQCPGNSQEAITVGAIKAYSSNEIADYSSRGVAGIKKPNILTSGTIYFNQIHANGTSFATPVITGVCASLVPSQNKNVSKIKTLLYSSAKDLGLPDHHQGFGLLDLEKLVEVSSNDQSQSSSKGQEQS